MNLEFQHAHQLHTEQGNDYLNHSHVSNQTPESELNTMVLMNDNFEEEGEDPGSREFNQIILRIPDPRSRPPYKNVILRIYI